MSQINDLALILQDQGKAGDAEELFRKWSHESITPVRVTIFLAQNVVPPQIFMKLTHASYFCYKKNYRRNKNPAAHAASARKEQVMKVRAISVWLAALTMVSLSFSASAKEQVPIKGEFATEFTFSAPPPVASLTLSGIGRASHLGNSTCSSDNEVVDFTHQPLPTMTGTLTLTAANGNTLTCEMHADVIPAQDGSITFLGTLTFTGGTGRFAHATGTAEFGGSGTPTSALGGVGWFSFAGTVTSPGASKK